VLAPARSWVEALASTSPVQACGSPSAQAGLPLAQRRLPERRLPERLLPARRLPARQLAEWLLALPLLA
jgi:hypothetical protein